MSVNQNTDKLFLPKTLKNLNFKHVFTDILCPRALCISVLNHKYKKNIWVFCADKRRNEHNKYIETYLEVGNEIQV